MTIKVYVGNGKKKKTSSAGSADSVGNVKKVRLASGIGSVIICESTAIPRWGVEINKKKKSNRALIENSGTKIGVFKNLDYF